MKKVSKLFFVALTLLGAACKPGLNVSSDYDRSINFSAYKTYSIHKQTMVGVNQLNEARIVSAIKAEMSKRGFMEDNSNPNLWINAITVMKNKQSLSVSANNYGHGGVRRPYASWGAYGSSYGTLRTESYKEGTLIIDLIDAQTKKLAWTATGTAEVTKKSKDPDAAVKEVVAKIMKSFPTR